MNRVLVFLVLRLVFRIVWAIARAIGLEAIAALRDVAPRVLSQSPRSLDVMNPASRAHCGQCGAQVAPGTPFCPSCGLAVHLERETAASAVMHTCRSCGHGVDLTDRYCVACGAALPSSMTPRAARPPAVDIAANLHVLGGAGAALVTLPFAGVLSLGLSGHTGAAAFLQGIWLPVILGAVTWGAAWTALSLAAAWGLRSGKAWALHATIAVSLLWSLTAVGAFVGIPLIIALMMPASRAFFGRGPGGNADSGSGLFGGSSVIVIGRR